MAEDCVDQPKCREDLIKRINTRMTTKNFLISSAIVSSIFLGIIGIAYNAYSERQKTIQESVKEQTKAVQKADKKLTEIEVNQQHVLEQQTEFKGQINSIEGNQYKILEELIKIREHQVDGREPN